MERVFYLYYFTSTQPKDILGSVMYVNTDPAKVAEKILADIDEKRAALGWVEVK